jgi:hypothetical protein
MRRQDLRVRGLSAGSLGFDDSHESGVGRPQLLGGPA